MDPPTLGPGRSLPSPYQLPATALSSPRCLHSAMNSGAIKVQLQVRAEPKELPWIGKGPLFYEQDTERTVPGAGTGLHFTGSLDNGEEGKRM